jgi:hypothetical protein
LHKAERLQVKRIRYSNQYEAYQADSRAPPVPRELIELIVRRVDARHFRRPVDFVEQVQQIYPDGQISSVYPNSLSSPSRKNISVYQKCKSGYMFRHPVPSRGVAQRHQRGAGMRWTRMALLTRALEVDGEIVWS